MNKLVIKEVKTKKKCQHAKGCDNQANDILKLKGAKKIYLCEKCLTQFCKDLVDSFKE